MNDRNVVLEKRSPDGMHEVRRGPERALMVGVEIGRPVWSMEDSLAELAQLAATAGVDVVAR